MKRFIVTIVLVALTGMAFADSKYAVGLNASVDNQTQSAKGLSDYTSSSLALQVFGSIALSATTEIDPALILILWSTKDPSGIVTTAGTDTAQGAIGLGVGYYLALATAGPFTLKSGVYGQAVNVGSPKGWSGSYSSYYGEIEVPVLVDVTVGPSWSLRVMQTLAKVQGSSYDNAVATGGSSYLKVNGFTPSIGAAYHF